MGDAENSQPSKKRAALKEISRDNPGLDDDESAVDEGTGTFKKASDEVMAGRRIVKVRRNQTTSTTTTPSSNPFAGIRLVPPSESSVPPAETTSKVESGTTIVVTPEATKGADEATGKEQTNVNKEDKEESDQNPKPSESDVDNKKVEIANDLVKPDPAEKVVDDEKIQDETKEDPVVEKSETDSKKEEVEGEKTVNDDQNDGSGERSAKGTETASFSSFQQLSSTQNAFTGFAGTGFSSTGFSFGVISKEGSPLGLGSEGSGSLFGAKGDQSSFGLGLPTNGNVSVFGNSGSSTGNKVEGSGFPSKEEVNVETGEENEKPVFAADSVLFEFLDGGWKERGKGELKVNVSTTGAGRARLVMRTKGNYRLILNANLYPEMKLTNMDKRGVTFACLNSASEGKDGLSTIALKFKDASIAEEFRATVAEHKGTTSGSLKTPENSPKASDE